MSMPRVLILTAAAVAAATAVLGATVTVATDFRQVVASATLIVRGHVTDVRVIAPSGGRVETVATVAVDSTLKGSSDAFVSVRVPGGRVGNLNVIAVDSPQFSTGEVAIFFLKAGADQALRPIGLSLGVYPVAMNPQTRQTAVSPPLAAGLTAALGPVVHGDRARTLMTIPEFESLVRLVIAGQARTGPRGKS
jgi:hypothetical protein